MHQRSLTQCTSSLHAKHARLAQHLITSTLQPVLAGGNKQKSPPNHPSNMHYDAINIAPKPKYIEINVCTRVTNCFSAHERVIFVFIYRHNTRVSAETVHHESAYITLFLTRHSYINKNDDIYTSSPCLARSVFVLLMSSQSIADDVTMTRQL